MNRLAVYELIKGERAFQDARWPKPKHSHFVGAYISYIAHYVAHALRIDATSDGSSPFSHDEFGGSMRRIAALCFAAMEEHGVAFRIHRRTCPLRRLFGDSRPPYLFVQSYSQETIINAIDAERAYQNEINDRWFETSEHIMLLQRYVAIANQVWCEDFNDYNEVATLNVIRKIAAIAVRAMEQHGAPARS